MQTAPQRKDLAGDIRAEMTATITRLGIVYPAAICPTCHGKIWPARLIDAHVKRHEDKQDLFDAYIWPLRKTFKAMRNDF